MCSAEGLVSSVPQKAARHPELAGQDESAAPVVISWLEDSNVDLLLLHLVCQHEGQKGEKQPEFQRRCIFLPVFMVLWDYLPRYSYFGRSYNWYCGFKESPDGSCSSKQLDCWCFPILNGSFGH